MMELILTRIFSVKLYYYYAFVVISLALLGSGASGVYIYLFPNFLAQKAGKTSSPFLHLFCNPRVGFSITLLAVDGWSYSLALQHPGNSLFFRGLCVSLAMTHLVQKVNQLHFFDLAEQGLVAYW